MKSLLENLCAWSIFMQLKTTREKQEPKSSLNLSIKTELKKQAKEELKYSSMSLSRLMEEKLIEFLDEQPSNPSIKQKDQMQEHVCPKCEAIATDAVLDKTGNNCPKCGEEIDR